MPTLKEYNAKLAGLRSTRKVTSILKMISVTRLRKAQEAQRNARVFTESFNRATARLTGTGLDADEHPLFQARTPPKSALILVLSSDKGYCGGFNHNLNRTVAQWAAEHAGAYERLQLGFCGRKGFLYFRNRLPVWRRFEDTMAKPDFEHASRVGGELQASFLLGEHDEVYLAYNAFRNALSQTPVVERLLPIAPASLPSGEATAGGVILDPTGPELLGALLPQLVNLRVFLALVSSVAGEHGARMRAMENATSNADKLIDSITLRRNRARQSAITRELIEVVAGAEALK